MKMIDVLNLMAQGKIKQGTKLEIGNKIYTYTEEIVRRECYFIDITNDEIELLEDAEIITEKFLNLEVELIPPKPKKYLIKLNVRGLYPPHNYVNYYNSGIKQWIEFRTKSETAHYQTHFTEKELQSIKLLREFLEDMKGRYELVEVIEDEDY